MSLSYVCLTKIKRTCYDEGVEKKLRIVYIAGGNVNGIILFWTLFGSSLYLLIKEMASF